MESVSMDCLNHLNAFRHLVVHCRKTPFDVYIGRNCKGMPAGQVAIWGNPFVMRNQTESERIRVTMEYENWIRSQPDLVAKAKRELKGKILGCFCAPLMCHGRVLSTIAHEPDVSSDVAPCVEKQSQCPAAAATGVVVSHQTDTVLSKQQLKNRRRHESRRLARSLLREASDKAEGASSIIPPDISSLKVVERFVPSGYVDIGINVTSHELKPKWREIIARAAEANVSSVLLTGTTVKNTEESINIARQWLQESNMQTLCCTAGVHPHHAKLFSSDTYGLLKELLKDPLVVAVGECGLDFFRNLSSQEQQIYAFREQVRLACETGYPLFVHERDAHDAVVAVLDEFSGSLPPVVIHCFTGTAEGAMAYLQRGFYIGFTGTICKKERGAHLREIIRDIPLSRIMIETDAPYMGFVKSRRNSEPADVVQVAEQIARCLNLDIEVVRAATTQNAVNFFRLPI